MAALLYPSKLSLKTLGICLALAAGLLLSSPPADAASQYVVISTEPASNDFPPGKVLGVGDSLVVPENSTMTLLGEDGSVVAIPGPAKVTVTEEALETEGETAEEAEKNRSTLSKLAELLAGKRSSAESLGVSRGFNAKAQVKGLDDPWVLSIHESGQGCVQNEAIRLGRATFRDRISIKVAGDDDDAAAELDWLAGEASITLPSRISPRSKELEVRAGGKTVLIDLSLVPDDLDMDDPMSVLGWMVDEGCESQALAFTRLLVHQAQ